jgi:hypothetical protein
LTNGDGELTRKPNFRERMSMEILHGGRNGMVIAKNGITMIRCIRGLVLQERAAGIRIWSEQMDGLIDVNQTGI